MIIGVRSGNNPPPSTYKYMGINHSVRNQVQALSAAVGWASENRWLCRAVLPSLILRGSQSLRFA